MEINLGLKKDIYPMKKGFRLHHVRHLLIAVKSAILISFLFIIYNKKYYACIYAQGVLFFCLFLFQLQFFLIF